MSEFMKGQLAYTVTTLNAAELAAKIDGSWQDGYIAFANSEKRLNQLPCSMDATFFRERIQGIADAEGYVTEVNLWRKNGSTIEEIAAEREENTFYVQHWLLDTAPVETADNNCWHRAADTQAGSHHNKGKRIFSDSVKSIEVVWPEKRLNFFLTAEGL